MLKFDIKRKINTLRDILVGKVPDPKAQVEQITIAMIYKFMDDIDLDGMEFGLSGAREFFKDDFEKYAWSNIMQSENSGQQRAILFAEGIDKMAMNPHLPQLFRDIFRGAYVPYRDPDTLNMFLKEISEFSYNNSEDLGNAFEYLLSIMGSQGDAGQFRTPRHIIDMIVEIVDPKKNETVLDPACGTAGFLISAYKHILENNKDENGKITLTADDRKRLSANFAGYDISPDMVRLSRVNMYLHKFTKPQISEYDTLTKEEKWDDSFDVILANPPFMTPKGGIIPHNRYRVQAKRAEVLFVDYIAEHLNPTGRAGIIVPEGIVFQSANAYKALRKYLVDDNLLYAVISLPAGVFNPYSGVKTSVLLFDKTFAKQKDEILFVKMDNDGYDLGAQRREIKKDDIPDIVKIIKAFKKGEDVSYSPLVTLASKEDIAKKDYILVGERYKTAVVMNSQWPLVELGEVLTYEQPTKYIVESVNYSNEYKTPVLTAGQSFLLGYTNETENIYCSTLPVIIFDDFTTSSQFVDFPFKVKSSAMKILKNDSTKTNIKYLYQAMKLINCDSSIHKRYWIAEFSKKKIPLPPLSVQEEIVAEIESYQKIIDGAKQIVDNYKPTIKIDPSWEMVKLKDICESITDGDHMPPPKSEIGVPFVTISNITLDRRIDFTNTFYVPQEYYNQIKESRKPFEGDILYTVTGSFGIPVYVDFDKEFCFQRHIGLIRSSKGVSSKFLYYYLMTPMIFKQAEASATGMAQKTVSLTSIRDFKVFLPPLLTQQQIVENMDEEMAIIEQNKRLIEIFEQKIKDKTNEIWGK